MIREGLILLFASDLQCIKNDAARVEPLLKGGVASVINLRNEKGQTALSVALEEGHIEIAKILIQHGAICDKELIASRGTEKKKPGWIESF